MKEKFTETIKKLLNEISIPEEKIQLLSKNLIDLISQKLSTEFITNISSLKSLNSLKLELKEIDDSCHKSAENILKYNQAIQDISNTIQDANLKNNINISAAQIFTSCEFQDIVNQRMGKIDKLILELKEEIKQALLKIIDIQSEITTPSNILDDKNLLNGPQSSADALTQDDIDKILKK
ncbi:MAG: chemotaxis protein [Rickettsiaceae bacterium]|nr:chemotaxis protein [Rickettsiaceae bacterium]